MTGHGLADLVFGPLLAFARIGCLVMVLPFLGAGSVPAMARIGLAVALTAIIVPMAGSAMPPAPASVVVFALMLLKEVAIGLTLGWLTATLLLSLPVAGQIISYQMGLSSVLLPNVETGPSSTLLSTVLNVAMPPLVLRSGLFMIPIVAILHSFQLLPVVGDPASWRLLGAGMALRLAIRAVSGEFAVALQLAAPFLVIGLIWQAALALMAKAAPALQIFFAAAPLQLLGGMVLLAGFVLPAIGIWREAMNQLLRGVAGW